MSRFQRIGRSLGHRFMAKVFGATLPSYFIGKAPAPENMISLFEGGWASALPIAGAVSGSSRLFEDERIRWFLEKSGGVHDATVLELGPLEGGHSYMLEKAGARQVVAIEANGLAWLKCLAVKETFGLAKVRFLLGDFLRHLETAEDRYDAVVACGILYHLKNPQDLFPLLRKVCDGPVLLWTMAWSERIRDDHPGLHKRFSSTRTARLPTGATVTLHRHEYQQTVMQKGFFGGNDTYSEWMSREDIQAAAAAAGYQVGEIAFDEPRHANGPALAMLLKPA